MSLERPWRACRILGVTTLGVMIVPAGCGSEPGECNLGTHPNQCVDRAAIWGSLLGDDAGASVPDGCPAVADLRHELVNAYRFDLEGWDFVDGPVEDAATDRCCYTTRDAPCE